jgi:hypothetical protein
VPAQLDDEVGGHARLAPVLGLVGRRAGQLPDLVDGGVGADGLEVVGSG